MFAKMAGYAFGSNPPYGLGRPVNSWAATVTHSVATYFPAFTFANTAAMASCASC